MRLPRKQKKRLKKKGKFYYNVILFGLQCKSNGEALEGLSKSMVKMKVNGVEVESPKIAARLSVSFEEEGNGATMNCETSKIIKDWIENK